MIGNAIASLRLEVPRKRGWVYNWICGGWYIHKYTDERRNAIRFIMFWVEGRSQKVVIYLVKTLIFLLSRFFSWASILDWNPQKNHPKLGTISLTRIIYTRHSMRYSFKTTTLASQMSCLLNHTTSLLSPRIDPESFSLIHRVPWISHQHTLTVFLS